MHRFESDQHETVLQLRQFVFICLTNASAPCLVRQYRFQLWVLNDTAWRNFRLVSSNTRSTIWASGGITLPLQLTCGERTTATKSWAYDHLRWLKIIGFAAYSGKRLSNSWQISSCAQCPACDPLHQIPNGLTATTTMRAYVISPNAPSVAKNIGVCV
jgi:hypothetical protein